jgi:formylglycine-generating enzyme required for sulfatase activity
VPVAVLERVDRHPLARGVPPAWASGWGQDAIAPWASITVGEVSQRLRWIPPGRSLMGSPTDEEGRYEDEGPQHEVRIDRGFWMFATPCTQALWETVMGANPSRFQSAKRPVEQVTWKDCQEFVARLNRRLAGLELALPSEAHWEYACRAGTTTATYAGDLEILEAHNAPLLDGIAWYGGNCGVGFELPNGHKMSSWDEKQYDFERGGTHAVGMKRANIWGLYDMLGNVWEWCADEYRLYSGGETFAGRVVRGGSWSSGAEPVRAACRRGIEPGGRSGSVGFRCAEFRSGSRLEEVER